MTTQEKILCLSKLMKEIAFEIKQTANLVEL